MFNCNLSFYFLTNNLPLLRNNKVENNFPCNTYRKYYREENYKTKFIG